MTTSTTCSMRPCRRPTRHPSGRCHDHRTGSTSNLSPTSLPPTPAIAASNEDFTPSLLQGDSPTLPGWGRQTHADGLAEFAYFERAGSVSDGGPSRVVYREAQSQQGVTSWVRVREQWMRGGKTHRVGAPAMLTYDEGGNLLTESYYLDGIRDRSDDGPTQISYANDGSVLAEGWEGNAASRRAGLPTRIEYGSNGVVTREQYYVGSDLHRADGPADVSYFESGEVKKESYFERGADHRIGGPAVIEYAQTGAKVCEEYFLHGGLHRIDGPAEVFYDESGEETPGRYRFLDEFVDDYEHFGERVKDAYADGEDAIINDHPYDFEADLAQSKFAPLTADHSTEEIVEGIAAGLRTTEGLRAYLDGTPIEWALSYEEGAAS